MEIKNEKMQKMRSENIVNLLDLVLEYRKNDEIGIGNYTTSLENIKAACEDFVRCYFLKNQYTDAVMSAHKKTINLLKSINRIKNFIV
jgi:hypothetical protein